MIGLKACPGYYLLKRLKRRVRSKWYGFSYRYLQDFIFIHINKTGGSSITKALGIPFEHKTALEKRAEIGERTWQRRFSFAIVRNPWDRVVSHYQFRVETEQTGLATSALSFSDWVHLAYGERDPQYFDQPKMFMPQWEWITDNEDRILVDFVGRFENLEEEFESISRRLKRPVLELPHVKKSSRGSYEAYYDARTREIIAEWFNIDIEKFGYRF